MIFDERLSGVQFKCVLRAEMSVAATAGSWPRSRPHFQLSTFTKPYISATSGHRLPMRLLIANKYRPSRPNTAHQQLWYRLPAHKCSLRKDIRTISCLNFGTSYCLQASTVNTDWLSQHESIVAMQFELNFL